MRNLKSVMIILSSTFFLLSCTSAADNSIVINQPLEESVAPTETTMPAVTATNTPEPEPVITRNIPYLEDGLFVQKLDLYLPPALDADTSLPIIMMIHQGGSNRGQMASLAANYMDMGFAVISIDHRETPEYQYPAHIEDGVCALGWIYSNAVEYGFDVERIFLLGYSSGGTMAAFLGSIDDFSPYAVDSPGLLPEDVSFAGVITFTGIFDYAMMVEGDAALVNYVTGLMGADYATAPEIWQEASPIFWVDGTEPDFLLFHGRDDHSILPIHSIEFAEALEAAGVQVELQLISGVGHMDLIGSEEAQELLTEFLLERID